MIAYIYKIKDTMLVLLNSISGDIGVMDEQLHLN